MKKIRICILSVICALCAFAGVATLNKNVASADIPTEVNTFEILDVAAIRNTTPEGIRFVARIKTEQKNALTDANFGVIVYPTSEIDGELTHTSGDVLDIPAVNWVDEEDTDLYNRYGFDLEYSYFTAVVAGNDEFEFPEKYYTQSLTARGYVKISDNPYVYTETQTARSIAYVAGMALADKQPDASGIYAKFAQPASLQVEKANFTLKKGNTDKVNIFYANVLLKHDLENVTIDYDVANESVATVSADGTITAVGGGITDVALNVTIGSVTTTFGLSIRVTEDVSNFAENLVQSKYLGYIVARTCSVAYEENANVNGVEANAFHVTSTTDAPAANTTGSYSLTISQSLIKQGSDAGYTTLRIVYYSPTTKFYTYNGVTGNAIASGASLNNVYDFPLASYADGLTLSFYDANTTRSPIDVYIKSIKFTPQPVDVDTNLATADVDCFASKGVIPTNENGVIKITSSGNAQASWDTVKTYFGISKTIIASAVEKGYQSVYIELETPNSIVTTNGTAMVQWVGGEGAVRTKYTFELSKYSNGLYLQICAASAKADVTISSIIFTGKKVTPTDFSGNIVSGDITGYFTNKKGAVGIAYETNATVADGVTANAIHLSGYTNTEVDNNGNYGFYVSKELIDAATTAGYTSMKIEMYSSNGYAGYNGSTSGTLLTYAGSTGKTTKAYTLSSITSANGLFLSLFNGEVVDIYITSITFTK